MENSNRVGLEVIDEKNLINDTFDRLLKNPETRFFLDDQDLFEQLQEREVLAAVAKNRNVICEKALQELESENAVLGIPFSNSDLRFYAEMQVIFALYTFIAEHFDNPEYEQSEAIYEASLRSQETKSAIRAKIDDIIEGE